MRNYNKWTVDSGQWTEKEKKLTTYHLPFATNNSGMALIIIMAIVAILSAIGITFMYMMRMEEKAAFNYMNSLKASYLAQSGIDHAVAILKSDGRDTGFVSYEGSRWGYKYQDLADSVFSAHVDDDNLSVDNDGLSITVSNDAWAGSSRDSRWIYVDDGDSNIVGRYAVLIIDESSKLNINTAGNISGPNYENVSSQGWDTSEISIERFIDAGNLTNTWNPAIGNWGEKSKSIVFYRYGGENTNQNRPGEKWVDDDGDSLILQHDKIDNDADGLIDETDIEDINGVYEGVDEPDEFVVWNPYNDITDTPDLPYITIEEVKMAGYDPGPTTDDIGNATFTKIKPYITVYSADENTTDSGLLRLNINLLKDATALYTAMYEAWEDLFPSINSYDELKQLAAQAAVNTLDYADTDNVSTLLEISSGDTTGRTTDSDSDWLEDSTKYWSGVDWRGAKITVFSGGTKQVRTITGNGVNSVDVAPNWDTGNNPSAGSYYYIEDKVTARGVEAIRINEIMVKPAYQWEAEELFFEDLVSAGTPGWSDTDLYYSGISTINTDTGIYSRTPDSQMEVDFEIWREGFYRVRALTYATAPESYTIVSIANDDNGTPPIDDDEYYLTIGSSEWEDDEWESALVVIASGTGVDQKRRVLRNTADTLYVTEPWNLPITGDFSLIRDHRFTITFESNNPDAVFAMGTEVGDIDLEAGTHNIGGWLLEDLGVIEVKEPGRGTIMLETTEYTTELNIARLDYIQLSQQPDCEYVELLNISDNEVDVGGWTLATSAGFVGTIPDDTKIEAGDYLVLAVDKEDMMWFLFGGDSVPPTVTHPEGKDEIFVQNTWPNIDNDNVVQLQLSASPVYIAEGISEDTVVLPGSMFTDLPPEPPMKWEDWGDYDSVGVSTLTDNSASWDPGQWKGATITANIHLDNDGVDTQITRQVKTNSTNTITLTARWSWNQNVSPAASQNYYIHFTPMSVTLYKGLLADQQIVSQVNYLPEDIKNQVAYTQENDVPVYGFVALEKYDPTAIFDRNSDGIDDLWHLNIGEEGFSVRGTSHGGTPANINSVAVLYDKDPGEDVKVPNLPFATVGDIKDVGVAQVGYSGFVSSATDDTLTDSDSPWTPNEFQDACVLIVSGRGAGQVRFIDDNTDDEITVTEYWDIIPDDTSEYVIFLQWSKLGYFWDGGEDIALVKRIVDKITVSQKRLEAEVAYDEFVGGGDDWSVAVPQGIFLTPSYYNADDDEPDTWWWGIDDRIQPGMVTGIYDLYIKGMLENDNGFVEVAVTTAAGTDTQLLQFSPDGTAYFGQIQIAGSISGAPSLNQDLLAVCVTKRNAGANGAYFDAVVLTPERRTYGRININTADEVVLYSLGLDEQQVVNIIDYIDSDNNPTEWDGTGIFGDETVAQNTPFKTIGEILDVPDITMDVFSQISNLITTKSKVFTIISTGQALRESDGGDILYPFPAGTNTKRYEILGEKKYMVVIER